MLWSQNLTSAAGTIGIGFDALNDLTSGTGNIALGYNAMAKQTDGTYNIAIGYGAMDAMATGEDNNIAIGYNAMGAAVNAATVGNVSIGNLTLSSVAGTKIDSAVVVGHNAGVNIVSGDNQVIVGPSAGATLTNGYNNTLLGKGADSSASGGIGQIAIGKSVSCTGDNIATLGIGANTASIGLDGSDTTWAAASSDERYKENIESSSAGLSFIEDLRPVTYNWKKAKDVQEELPLYKEGSEEPVLGHEYGETLHGFIAQEVKEAIDKHSDIKEGFKMWKLKDDGIQTVADGNLMPIMVKAIQELSAKVEELEAKLK